MKNIKGFFKKFSNKGPKAKIVLGLIALIFLLTIIIVVNMRKTVSIDIDGKNQTIVTYKGTVEDVLKENNIDVISKDKVEPSLNSKVSENEVIKIQKAVPVTVVIAGQEHEILTAEETVGDMLHAETDYIREQGGDYDEDDEVTPSRETRIGENLMVSLVQVKIEEVIEKEVQEYETITQTDENKDINSKAEVVQVGKNGTMDVRYRIYNYEDGTTKKIMLDSTLVEAPQDEIIVKGSGYFMSSRSGEQVKIKGKSFYVSATAYYCGDNAITATGRRAVRNKAADGISTIAVDPSVIPLGTLVYVQGYGKAVAADVGTAIKGNKIDVYTSSLAEARAWGRKDGLELGIIAYPGEW